MKKSKYLEMFNPELAQKLMLEGKNQEEIGKIMGGIPKQRVSDLFKSFGIKFIRRSFPINDTYFDEIDTEDKAYSLGFLIADGCIREERRKNGNISRRICFANSVDDKEAIELIHSRICPDAVLSIDNQSTSEITRKDRYTLQWTSEHMVDTLINKYHILPKKTLDAEFMLPMDSIPNNMWRHLIRGFFDGDGHCGKWEIQFIFTAVPFMKQVLAFFKDFNIKIYEVQGKTVKYYKAVIHGGQKVLSFTRDFFYKDAHYYLSRKYKQFHTEVTIETKESIAPQSVETEPAVAE